MTFNFDELIERRDTNSVKWDFPPPVAGATGSVLPLWVADMDFRAPPAVLDALKARVEHGIFGYARHTPSYIESIRAWLDRRHGWRVESEWIVPIPGVVPGIRLALDVFTAPGDRVVIQPPVYHPFRIVPFESGRVVVENPLLRTGGRYEIDFEGLERAIGEETRLVVFCSPHNPVGRVWRRDELERLVELCARRGALLLSDEIHCDLVMSGHVHRPTGLVAAGLSGPSGGDGIVTFVSPTKTFNLASLSAGAAVIPDPEKRRRFKRRLTQERSESANVLGLAASEAAYRHGAPWLDALLAYLEGNYRLLVERLAREAPDLAVAPLEGTYLAWVDFSSLKVADRELKEALFRAGVWLEDGPKYGTGGEGFQRVNIACPRARLDEALTRILAAVASLRR